MARSLQLRGCLTRSGVQGTVHQCRETEETFACMSCHWIRCDCSCIQESVTETTLDVTPPTALAGAVRSLQLKLPEWQERKAKQRSKQCFTLKECHKLVPNLLNGLHVGCREHCFLRLENFQHKWPSLRANKTTIKIRERNFIITRNYYNYNYYLCKDRSAFEWLYYSLINYGGALLQLFHTCLFFSAVLVPEISHSRNTEPTQAFIFRAFCKPLNQPIITLCYQHQPPHMGISRLNC